MKNKFNKSKNKSQSPKTEAEILDGMHTLVAYARFLSTSFMWGNVGKESAASLLGDWVKLYDELSTRFELCIEFTKLEQDFDTYLGKFFTRCAASSLDPSKDDVLQHMESLTNLAKTLSTSSKWGKTTAVMKMLRSEWKAVSRIHGRSLDHGDIYNKFNGYINDFFDRLGASKEK